MASVEENQTRMPRALKLVGFGISAVALLLVAVFIFLQTAPGRSIVSGFLEDLLSDPQSGLAVEIDGLGGNPLGTFSAQSITVIENGHRTISVQDIAGTWNPFALLSGTLSVDDLTAEALVLEEAPDVPDGLETPGDLVPDLPFDLAIASLSVKTLQLPGQLSVTAPAFRLEGKADIERGAAINVSADLVPQGTTKEQLSLSLKFAPDSEFLDVDIQLQTQDQGALGQYLFGEPLSGTRLSVKGAGPLSTWKGNALAVLDGTELADLSLSVNGADLVVTGPVNLQPLFAGSDVSALSDPIDMDVSVTFAEGVPQTYTATLVSRGLRASLSGGLRTTQALSSLRFDIRLQDPDKAAAALEDWSIGAASVSGDLAENDDGLIVTMSLTGEQITGPDITLNRLDGDAVVKLGNQSAPDRIELTGSGSFDISKPFPEPTPGTWELAGQYDSDNGKLAVSSLVLKVLGATLTASADIDPITDEQGVKADLSVADLAQWQGLLGETVDGSATATLAAKWPGADGTRQIELEAKGKALGFIDPALSALLGPSPDLTLRIDQTADGTALPIDAAVTGKAIKASLSGSLGIELDTIDAEVSADLKPPADLEILAGIGIEGPVTVRGTLSGPFDALETMVQVNAAAISANALTMTDIAITADLANSFTAPSGPLEMSFGLLGERVEGGAQLSSQQDGTWQFGEIALASPTISLNGAVASKTPGAALSGELILKARLTDLWDRFLGVPALASAEGNIVLDDEDGAQSIHFDLAAKDLEIWLPNQRRYEGEAVSVKGEAVINDQVRIDSLVLQARNATSGDLSFDRAIVEVTPQGDGLDVTANLVGTMEGPLEVSMAASLASARLARPNTLTLKSLTGTIASQKLALASPVDVVFGAERTYFDGLSILAAGGHVDATLDYGEQRRWIKLTVSNLDIGLVSLLATEDDVFGTLNVDLEVDLTGIPVGRLTIEVDELLFGDELLQDPFDILINARLEPEIATARLTIETADRLKLEAVGEAAISIDPEAFTLDVDVNQPVSLAVTGQAELDDLWPLAGQYDHQLGGTASVDFGLSGTIENPVLAGTFGVRQATYRNLATGFQMQAGQVDFGLKDGLLTLAPTTATDGTSGVIALSGWVRPFAPGGVRADLTAEIDKARLVNLRTVTLRASGKVAYQKEAEAERLTGKVSIDEAEVSLIERLPPEIVELQVIEINRPDGLVSLPEKPADQQTQTQVSADITAKNQVFVRGRGLESEWSGDVQVSGTLAEPRLSGRLTLLRGDFQFAGKRFDLEDGTIDFSGGRTIDPRIFMTAIYDVETLRAQLKLNGPISKPSVALTSRPPLPEDEILSRIMFGTDKDRLSALQAAQLAAAAASMSGSGGGFDVVGRIRKALTLERLEIGTRGEDGTSPLIRGGKYLTKNIYVEVGTARDEDDATSASIDADLTKHLSIGTEATTTGTRKLRLRWKWDY